MTLFDKIFLKNWVHLRFDQPMYQCQEILLAIKTNFFQENISMGMLALCIQPVEMTSGGACF